MVPQPLPVLLLGAAHNALVSSRRGSRAGSLCHGGRRGDDLLSLCGIQLPGTPGAFVAEHQRELLAENRECARCEFFEPCGGYFKWPDREYSCDGVRSLFRTLWDASVELQQDVDAALEAQGGKQR
jgi:hypothetical protein